jgi:hypothetical protein
MSILYFRKSGALVLRMLDKGIAEIRLPGYDKCLLVDFDNESQVAPLPLTTLRPMAGGSGDIYLTPAYMFAFGILPDASDPKHPASKGGSYAEMWRTWSSFRCLDPSGDIADSLDAIKAEMAGGSLAECASSLAAGDIDRALAQLDAVATEGSPMVRHARNLIAPGYRSDKRRVLAMLRFAVAGVLSHAL